MADHNFIRYFIILNEKQKKYTNTDRQPLSGYCKVESLNNRAVLTLSIRNMATIESGYGFYVILKESSEPVKVGDVFPQKDGSLFTSFETRADALFDTDKNITTLDAVALCDNKNGTAVLMGYSNKRAQMNDNSDIMHKVARIASVIDKKVENTYSPEEAEAVQVNSNNVECSCDDCAFSNQAEAKPDLMDNPQPALTPVDILAEKIKSLVSDNEGNIQSYARLLTGMYKNMVSGSDDNREEPCTTTSEPLKYWDIVKDHYFHMLTTYKSIDPFYKHSDNVKWMLVKNECNYLCGNNLIGLVYEGGDVKYIVNGTPVYTMGISTYPPAKGSFWMPVKCQEEFNHILGYWLTIIDASNGSVVMPFVKF